MRLPISVTHDEARQIQLSLGSDSTLTLVNGETVIVELQGKLEISRDDEPNIDEEAARAGLEFGRLDMSDPVRFLKADFDILYFRH